MNSVMVICLYDGVLLLLEKKMCCEQDVFDDVVVLVVVAMTLVVVIALNPKPQNGFMMFWGTANKLLMMVWSWSDAVRKMTPASATNLVCSCTESWAACCS